jgi:hypothetical protein
MIHEPALPTESHLHRPHVHAGFVPELPAPSHPVPVLLIEVPLMAPRVRPARRPSVAATERIRAHGASPLLGQTRQRRRRLRREVRMAGYVLAIALPLALALALLRGAPAVGRDGSGPAPRSPVATELRPPGIRITLDPSALNPQFEPESTVVLPGYLLPDEGEGAEEPAHAGG